MMKFDAPNLLILVLFAGLIGIIGTTWVPKDHTDVAIADSLAQERATSPMTATPRHPQILYLAPVGDKLRSLRVASMDGNVVQEIFTTSYRIESYSVGPKAARVALAVGTENPTINLWIVDVTGDNPHQLLDCAPDACTHVAWSPAGNVIAYERHDLGKPSAGRIWLYDLSTGETAPLVEDHHTLGQAPTWSPDGSQLAYYNVTSQSIDVMTLTTGETFQIPSRMGAVGVFSPDGHSMVYPELWQVGRLYVSELWVASLGENGAGSFTPLVDKPQDDQNPVWSPDGKWIAFGRHNLKNGPSSWLTGQQLVIYEPETGQLRQLTHDLTYNNTAFAWSPTGEHLLIQRFRLEQDSPTPELWLYDLTEGNLQLVIKSGAWGSWLSEIDSLPVP